MEIKQLYIENFKGVQKKTIIEIGDKLLTVLNGPNGFGKTTIFDVIELCLSGKMERSVSYSYVMKNNADFQKPFYQNKSGVDVVLKIWIVDGANHHIIIKRLDKANNGRIDGGRANRPDAWQLLETYYSSNPKEFENHPEFAQLRRINQQFIDEIFFPGQPVSLVQIYPLFHYLQQEENIYFLKKNEDEKKKELDFLLQTRKESEELERAKTLSLHLNNIKQALQSRINELGTPFNFGNPANYQRLSFSRTWAWDAEDPFADIPINELNATFEQYKLAIDTLISFSKY